MPRVVNKQRFKEGELVVPFEPFTGVRDDGTPFVVTPDGVLDGGSEIVRRYPWVFGRQGDEDARREYGERLLAEQRAERERREREEAKRREEEQRRIQKLADELEVEERKRREEQKRVERAQFGADAEHRRRRLEANEQLTQRERLERLAMVEVERGLAEADAR